MLRSMSKPERAEYLVKVTRKRGAEAVERLKAELIRQYGGR